QLLLIVVDASHPAREEHISTVRQVLEEIKAADVPSLLVYNKIDLLPPEELELLKQERTSRLMVSATRGTGLRELLETVEQRMALSRSMVTLRVPVARGDIVAGLHRRGRILRQEVDQNNLILEAEIPPALVAQLSEFLVRSE
ncbi:MAG TPA: GTPase HflX, partial [Candidatus Hydrogenedentes bacterium]|nr:GTPase HflX [Candidatus Hydrogenedentota bacterium]